MSDVETQLKEFCDKLKRYQKVFRDYQEHKVGVAPEGFNVDEERQLREELNETWGELENTIIRLWGERPKQTQYNSVFPVFETALSGNFESPLTGGAIASAIQVVIKCIGKAKSSPESVYKKAPSVADKKQNTVKPKIARSKPKGTWFSMSNPIVWIIATLIVAAVIYFLFR